MSRCNTCNGKSKGKFKCPCYLKCNDNLGIVDLNTYGGGICIGVEPGTYDSFGRAVFQARDFQWIHGSGVDFGNNPAGQLEGSITNPYDVPMLAKVEMRFQPNMTGSDQPTHSPAGTAWRGKTITFHAKLSNQAAATYPGDESITVNNPAVLIVPLTNNGTNFIYQTFQVGAFSQTSGTAVLYKTLAVGETWNYYSSWWATFHEGENYPVGAILIHGYMMVSEYGFRNQTLNLPPYLVGA